MLIMETCQHTFYGRTCNKTGQCGIEVSLVNQAETDPTIYPDYAEREQSNTMGCAKATEIPRIAKALLDNLAP